MASITVQNSLNYKTLSITAFESTAGTEDSTDVAVYIFTDKAGYVASPQAPNYTYTESDITAPVELVPSDFGMTGDTFPDGLYKFVLTFKDDQGDPIEDSHIATYLVLYGVGVIVLDDLINIGLQLEEDDDKHYKDALEALWPTVLIDSMWRNNTVGLVTQAMNILDYINDLLEE